MLSWQNSMYTIEEKRIAAKRKLAKIKASKGSISSNEPVAIESEYNAGEEFLIGTGRGMIETGRGIKQIAMEGAEALGFDVGADEYQRQLAQEKQLYDQGVGSSPPAKAGEIAGMIAATAPTMFIPGGQAASLGTRVASGATAGALGAATQPVYDGDFAAGKVEQTASGAAFGGGATYGLDKLRNIMPKNLMSKFYQHAQAKGVSAVNEGEILETITGISLTPAEKAKSKGLQMLENLTRQSLITADDIAKYDQKVARQGMASVARLARQISRQKKGAETLGGELQKASKQAADDLINMRRIQAIKDYGVADDLSGGAKIIGRNKYVQELKNIIDEYKGSDSADAIAVVSQAKAKLARAVKDVTPKAGSIVDETGKPLTSTQGGQELVKQTVKDAVSDRSFLGNAAKGTGNVFKDIDKRLDQRIASRLHKALSDDLMDAEQLGDVGEAIKVANANYMKNSQTINALEASPLGKILGKEFDDAAEAISTGSFNSVSGEKALKKIMGLEPSEIKMTMRQLDRINPSLGDDVRAYVLRDALENSLLPPSAGMDKGSMSFNKFMTNLKKNKIANYGLSSKDFSQMKDIVSTMERIGDRSGYNFSGTQVQADVSRLGRDIIDVALGNARKGGALLMEAVGLRRIAKAMTTKEGRDALMVISKPYQQGDKLQTALNKIERLTVGAVGAEIGQEAGE